MSSADKLVLLLLVTSALLAISDGHVFSNLLSNLIRWRQNCQLCMFSASLVNYALRTKKGYEKVEQFTNSFCVAAKIQTPEVCSNVTRLFNHEVTKVLSGGIVTPDQICGYLSKNKCGNFHDPLADWEVNLNVSNSLSPHEIESLRQSRGQREDSVQRPYRIIQISDTHVDLRYQPGSPAVCDKPLCCRSDSIPLNETKPAGYWGSYGECDIPMHTFESTLRAINDIRKREGSIDYLIWTGDIQPHDVWMQTKEGASATYDAVFAKIFEYLPDITVLPTLGNHEMVPVDSFSPSNLLQIAREDSPEWLYRKIDSSWSRWLPADTIKTITKDGFYATMIRPGLKVVSLNTNFCHNKNFWLYINSTDPGNQLQWLIHELQISELLHESVHIIGHIPPGGEDCLRVWSKNFNRIVQRYQKTITAQFYGHTHTAGFEIFYDANDLQTRFKRSNSYGSSTPQPISVGFIGPSVTSFIGLNPSFRVYTIDPSRQFMPVDFETYYMNLTAANLQGERAEPHWISTGSFAKLLGIQDTSPRSLHKLLMKASREIHEDIKQVQAGVSDPIQPFNSIEYQAPLMENHYNDPNSTLYKLYLMYNSYSDEFSPVAYSNVTVNERLKFLCQFFTSKSHNYDICEEFIHFTPPSSTSDLIA